MKVKKFPQSHLEITNNAGKKLIIDPGYLTFKTGQFKVADFQKADLYLITHQHKDHLGPETIKEIVREKPIFGNFDVVNKLKEVGVTQAQEIKDGQLIEVGGFKIKAVYLSHFNIPGVEMPPNTGFIIDNIFFHPGDGWKIDNFQIDKSAIPISSPAGGELKLEQGLALAKSLQAKVIIPIHYDNSDVDPNLFAAEAEKEGIEVRVLVSGQETEI